LGAMEANVLVEFENIFLIGGIFLQLGAFFLTWRAKNYFGIEKISYFGNYMDPCRNLAFNQRGGREEKLNFRHKGVHYQVAKRYI